MERLLNIRLMTQNHSQIVQPSSFQSSIVDLHDLVTASPVEDKDIFQRAKIIQTADFGANLFHQFTSDGVFAPLAKLDSAAKWAVVGFTQSLAAEAGPDKVRVNCIQPGVVEGDRVDRIIDAKAKALGVSFDEIKDRMLAGVSMHTTVTAQDIANTALFLATDAGKHISGQSISVCGGARYLV